MLTLEPVSDVVCLLKGALARVLFWVTSVHAPVRAPSGTDGRVK